MDQIRRIKISREKKYKDNRDWKKYNNKLVREVELIFDFPLNRKIIYRRRSLSIATV